MNEKLKQLEKIFEDFENKANSLESLKTKFNNPDKNGFEREAGEKRKEDDEKMAKIYNKKLAKQRKMRGREAKLRQKEAERQEKIRAKKLKEAREREQKYKEKQNSSKIKPKRFSIFGAIEIGVNEIKIRNVENKLRKLHLKEAEQRRIKEEKKVKLKEQRLAEQRRIKENKKKIAEAKERRELTAKKINSILDYFRSLPVKIKANREKRIALKQREKLRVQAEKLRANALEEKRNNVKDKLSLLNKIRKPSLLQIKITKGHVLDILEGNEIEGGKKQQPTIIFGRKIKERKENIAERIEKKAAEKIEKIEEKIAEVIAENKTEIKEESAEKAAERKEEEKAAKKREEEKIAEQKAAEKKEKEAEKAEKQSKEQFENKKSDNVNWLSRLWRTKKREEKLESELAELLPFKEELLKNEPEKKEADEKRKENEAIKNLTNFSERTENAERKAALAQERREAERKIETQKIMTEEIPNILFALEKEIVTNAPQREPLKASEMFKRKIPQAYDPFKKKLTILKDAEVKSSVKKENVISNVVYPLNSRLPERKILIQNAEVKRKREEIYQRLREELGVNAKEL